MTDYRAKAALRIESATTETTNDRGIRDALIAQAAATLYLAEQQNMSNRMHYAIDFATGDEHYAELGREIGAALGVKPLTATTPDASPQPESLDPYWCANCGRTSGHFAHCRAKKVAS